MSPADDENTPMHLQDESELVDLCLGECSLAPGDLDDDSRCTVCRSPIVRVSRAATYAINWVLEDLQHRIDQRAARVRDLEMLIRAHARDLADTGFPRSAETLLAVSDLSAVPTQVNREGLSDKSSEDS